MSGSQPSPPPPSQLCPACGEANPLRNSHCWLCWASLPPVGKAEDVRTPPPPPPTAQDANFTFTLSSLFLAMTLIAVLTGLTVIAPGLGAPLWVLSILAWIRTSRAVYVGEGRPIDPAQETTYKFEKFVESLGLMFVTCVAAGAAGFAACSAVCIAGVTVAPGGYRALDHIMWISIAAGVGGGLVVLSILLRKWWPRRPKRPSGF